MKLGLNEADTLKFISMLIYYLSEQGLYTQDGWNDVMLIKGKIKREESEIN